MCACVCAGVRVCVRVLRFVRELGYVCVCLCGS